MSFIELFQVVFVDLFFFIRHLSIR